MFKRSREADETAAQQTDGVQDVVAKDDAVTGAAPVDEAGAAKDLADDGPEPAEELDETDASELLRRLADNGTTESSVDSDTLTQLSEELARHADSIGVSARAQREAQRLLGMVARERAKVSAEASVMLSEAQELAARLRSEAEEHAEKERDRTRRRAAKAKAEIEALQVELRAKAEDDVADYSTKAEHDALDRARQQARDYVERATRIATRDAEEHRREARASLDRSQVLVADTAETVRDLVDGLSRGLHTLGTQLDELRTLADQVSTDLEQAKDRPAIDELVEEELERQPAAAPEPTAADPTDASPEETTAAEETAATEDSESSADSSPDSDTDPETDVEDEASAAADEESDAETDADTGAASAKSGPAAKRAAAGRSTGRAKGSTTRTSTTKQRSGRPLGAMYGEDDSRRRERR